MISKQFRNENEFSFQNSEVKMLKKVKAKFLEARQRNFERFERITDERFGRLKIREF